MDQPRASDEKTIPVAGRVWCFFLLEKSRAYGGQLHRETGTTPQEKDFSGRVYGSPG